MAQAQKAVDDARRIREERRSTSAAILERASRPDGSRAVAPDARAAVVVPIGEAAPEITAVPVGGRGRAA